MIKYMLAGAAVLFASSAFAEQKAVTFYADTEIKYVRAWNDYWDSAVVEFIAPRVGIVRCVAMDDDGEALAVGLARAEYNAIEFENLPADMIHDVTCQYADGS